MKKIRLTIVSAGEEELPGCEGTLAACAEFEIIARYASLTAAGLWHELSSSDVVLLDEAVVRQDGSHAVRRIYDSFPFIRILLIMEKSSRNKTMEAISMGITGVMERLTMVSSVRKAISVLYSGETWVSRRLVKTLHGQLNQAGEESGQPVVDGKKLH
jgi:DNA-binding NarL/FixJ family response regulator